MAAEVKCIKGDFIGLLDWDEGRVNKQRCYEGIHVFIITIPVGQLIHNFLLWHKTKFHRMSRRFSRHDLTPVEDIFQRKILLRWKLLIKILRTVQRLWQVSL